MPTSLLYWRGASTSVVEMTVGKHNLGKEDDREVRDTLVAAYEILQLARRTGGAPGRYADGGIEVALTRFHNFDEVRLKVDGRDIVLGGRNTVTGEFAPAELEAGHREIAKAAAVQLRAIKGRLGLERGIAAREKG